jgi:hypothetical protein
MIRIYLILINGVLNNWNKWFKLFNQIINSNWKIKNNKNQIFKTKLKMKIIGKILLMQLRIKNLDKSIIRLIRKLLIKYLKWLLKIKSLIFTKNSNWKILKIKIIKAYKNNKILLLRKTKLTKIFKIIINFKLKNKLIRKILIIKINSSILDNLKIIH